MKTLWANLQFALYCASIIVGAGVLTMPLTGRLLGFVPLLIVTILVALLLMVIYRRLAHTLFVHVAEVASAKANEVKEPLKRGAGIHTDLSGWDAFINPRIIMTEVQKGPELLNEVVDRTGVGSAGHATLLVGLFFYVFFADIGYIIIGNRSLNAVAATLKGNIGYGSFVAPGLGVALVVVALALPLLMRRPSARRGASQKFLMMAGWWCLAIGVLINTDSSGLFLGGATLGDILGSALFLGAILAAMRTGTDTIQETRHQDGLNAQHRVNVVVMIIELIFLAITGVLIVGLFFRSGMIEKFHAFALDRSSFSDWSAWSRVIGVVLFSYVGTGIFNLCSYPELFEENSGARGKLHFRYVVVLGTLIPLVLYLGWTVVTALVLSPQEMAAADAINEPTHIVIARKAVQISQEGAWIITITGYLFALMAVTSACNGFTESLADGISIAIRRSSQRHDEGRDFRPVILVLAALVALARDVFPASVDISAILSIAGIAGGGLLILILPFFFPYPLNRRTRARYWEIAVVLVMAVILIAGIMLEPTGEKGYHVLTWIKWGIAAGVASMVLWLLFSEPVEQGRPFYRNPVASDNHNYRTSQSLVVDLADNDGEPGEVDKSYDSSKSSFEDLTDR